MKTKTLLHISLLLAGISFQQLNAQQWVISSKDQTRPNPNSQTGISAGFSDATAAPFNGYNRIWWNATTDPTATRYVVEYSADGVDFQTAGEIVPSMSTGSYEIKHYTTNTEPLLYRIRTETASGRMIYSKNFSVDGIPVAPLRLYPNTISGDMLNVNSNWPIQRINIFSLDGNQVFAKDINGQRDYIPVAIPTLSKGMYVVHFMGDGWTYSEKILVP